MIICFCGGSGLKHFWRELFSLPTINPAHSQKEEASDNRPQWAVVVAMTDDGGSSRAIMDALGGLPVGDCRNVGLAVADGMHHALSQRVTTTVEDHEAASSLLLLDAVRWMHDLLSHRLCPEDAEVARDELMDVVSQLAHIICTTRAGSQKKEAHPQRLLAAHLAHTALLAFLAAVGVCRQAPFSPSDHLNESEGETSNFTFRNASVGNLVLSGLLLIELERQRHLAEAEPYSTPSSTQLPLFSALKTFLDTLLCVDQMSVMLNFDISVIPTLDYHHQLTNTTSSRSSTATSFTHETPSVRCPPEDAATSLLCGGGSAKLPRVALEVEWADWTTTWGQRAVSYGGGGDDGGNDDPLVTKKASHHYPAAGGHDVDTAAAASSHRCSSTRGVPKRINVWQETSQRNGNHDRSIIRIVPSPVVTQLLSHGRCVIEETRRDNGEVLEQCAGVSSVMTINSQRSQQQQRRCVLARGSFLTSTLAAVAPHLSCLQPHNGCDERREATATDDNRTGWEPVSQCETPLAPLSSSSDDRVAMSTGLMMNGWLDNETSGFSSSTVNPQSCGGEEEEEQTQYFFDVGAVVSFVESQFPALNITTIWLPTNMTTNMSTLPISGNSLVDDGVIANFFDVRGLPPSVKSIINIPGETTRVATCQQQQLMFNDCSLAQHVLQFGGHNASSSLTVV